MFVDSQFAETFLSIYHWLNNPDHVVLRRCDSHADAVRPDFAVVIIIAERFRNIEHIIMVYLMDMCHLLWTAVKSFVRILIEHVLQFAIKLPFGWCQLESFRQGAKNAENPKTQAVLWQAIILGIE